MSSEATQEARTTRRSLWLAGALTVVAVGAIGSGLYALVDWLRPPPIEGPPPELRSQPGLQRFVPHTPRSLLASRTPRSDDEEPPAVPPEHPFAKTRITGRVYDVETGDGIVGAAVRVRPTFGVPKLGAVGGDGSAVFTTRADGSYAMKGIPPGTFDLEVQAPGYSPAKSSFKKFSALEDDDGFDVGLVRGGALEGVVLSADRRPVAGARVTATTGDTVSIHPEATLATTGADGHFVLDPVQARELRVYATHPVFGSRLAVVPASEEPNREVELVLDRGRTIRGLVRDADGPLRGAQVMLGLQRLDERIVATAPATDGVSVTTDASGTFELSAASSGPVVVVAQAKGYEVGSMLVADGASDDPAPRVELTLQRAVDFGGVVLGADGRPAFRAQVAIASLGRRGASRMPLETWTTEDGRFLIEGVPKTGPYRVMVHHFAHPPLNVTEEQIGTNHRYQLEPEGKILGTIVDAVTGAPVTRYEYAVAGPVHRQSGAVSLSGSFEVDQLPAGTYTVYVDAEGFESAVVESVIVSPGETVKNVTVRLRPSGGIAGHVRGAAGGGSLVIHAVGASAEVEAQAEVGEDGGFNLDDLPSGTYTLIAVGEDGEGEVRGELANVSVESGRVTRDVEIVVAPIGPRPG
ncbi:carboxypeptidase-like regulatory domain-containing protein [Myxococcota bacterium]|nr:carboxypeptidase-like regulatory domain-containing protein [Myxococcota bacterium]